eukprot:782800-Pelagomonas_calceolata.AAC.5
MCVQENQCVLSSLSGTGNLQLQLKEPILKSSNRCIAADCINIRRPLIRVGTYEQVNLQLQLEESILKSTKRCSAARQAYPLACAQHDCLYACFRQITL